MPPISLPSYWGEDSTAWGRDFGAVGGSNLWAHLKLLYETGEKEAAEKHARELLRMCRQDNLGLRYDLARWLHEQGREKELYNHLRYHNAFSRDPWKHDAGFGEAVPEAMPERYWEISGEHSYNFRIGFS